jgi:hypothetical protein
MEFGEFYKQLGLKEYPFSTYTSENEVDKLDDLFVMPPCYDPLLESYKRKSTLVLSGERGTGKTFLVTRLGGKPSKDELLIFLDDYSDLKIKPQPKDFHVFLIKNIAEELFFKLTTDTDRIKKASEEQKLLLSYLLSRYVSNISKAKLRGDIEKIQIGTVKRAGNWFYNKFRGVLNWGATATTSIVSDLVAKHFATLPPIDEGKVKNFFPEINIGAKTDFIDQKESFVFFGRLLSLVHSLGYVRLTVILDKLDEDDRFNNDAQKISEFIEPILKDSKLLLHDNLQIVISVWSVPYRFLKDKFRTQKHDTHTIEWTDEKLIQVINSRLDAYSDGDVVSVADILAQNEDILLDKIIPLANKNPRDLWHIMDSILKSQYILDENSKITEPAADAGIDKFVREFNYYEYYPRKANARANTMDIYSYVQHLQKLDSPKFSKSALNEKARTGGSTDNYVTNMEKIGLIKKTGQKTIGGGVEYIIADPKVVYAMEKGIKIQQ